MYAAYSTRIKSNNPHVIPLSALHNSAKTHRGQYCNCAHKIIENSAKSKQLQQYNINKFNPTDKFSHFEQILRRKFNNLHWKYTLTISHNKYHYFGLKMRQKPCKLLFLYSLLLASAEQQTVQAGGLDGEDEEGRNIPPVPPRTHCPQTAARGFKWPQTKVNSSVRLPCPQDPLGSLLCTNTLSFVIFFVIIFGL